MNETTHDTIPDATDHETRHDTVSVHAASVALGITEDAVRARLRRGGLAGAKRGTTWIVDRSSLDAVLRGDATRHDVARPDDMRSRDATPHATRRDATPVAGSIDLRPLVEHIAGLEQQVRQLTEASTVWQVRAMQAEEQLKQLTATVEATGSPESNEQRDENARIAAEETAAPGARGDLLERLSRWLRGK